MAYTMRHDEICPRRNISCTSRTPSSSRHPGSLRNLSADRHLEIRLPVSGLEKRPGCHPERSEGSRCPTSQILSAAKDDSHYLQMSDLRTHWIQGESNAVGLFREVTARGYS